MLFGEHNNTTTGELPAVLSFQHKLLQEYLAAVFIAEQVKRDTLYNFLSESFPTWERADIHREVINFTFGILSETDASPMTMHLSNILARHTHDELNGGEVPSIILSNTVNPQSLLGSCEREGNVPTTINPYLCEYPACGRPLAEVLENTGLAYISDIDENDPLQLIESPAQIIVRLSLGEKCDRDWDSRTDSDLGDEVGSGRYDRLWQTLHSVSTSIVALDLYHVRSANITKLHNFSQLKYLGLCDCHCGETAGQDLTESIEAWEDQSQLTYCTLDKMSIPKSLMTALCKCTHLKRLNFYFCDFDDTLSLIAPSTPPTLRDLRFVGCSLQGADVDNITQALKEGRLNHLEYLDLQFNTVGEGAVGHLLEALISIRPDTEFTLDLYGVTNVDEDGNCTEFSDQFITEWKAKLTGTDIKVEGSRW